MSIGPSSLQLPYSGQVVPWSGLERWPQSDELRFVLLSDRTGFTRSGVFERAIAAANLLRPHFVIHIGDAIEGYTDHAEVLAREWSEFDALVDTLEVPFFRVPGNHDVSNTFMRNEWLRRYSVLHYHFRVADVLFLVLDTQDPPPSLADFVSSSAPYGSGIDALRREWEADPHAFARRMECEVDSEGAQPAALSREQVDWAVRTLDAQRDVRWTVLLMHVPMWQGENAGFERIRSALAGRPYTAFAGHLHNYQRRVIDGCDHIRLGSTGGAWVTTMAEGNFDHITVVTISEGGAKIANLVLDGVLGPEGGSFRPTPMFG